MKVVAVASGQLAASDAAWLTDAEIVIAADGGAASLARLGRRPDVLIGDLDSIEPGLVAQLEAAGTRVDRHPADKEASDTEMALKAAVAAGATEVVVLGAFGGSRLDHELANVLLLADPAHAGLDVRAVQDGTRLRALHGRRRLALDGAIGDLVTLLPVGGDAVGVTTAGLRWELAGATLHVGRSRGLSNLVAAVPASVALDDGTLLVVESTASKESVP
jgi:thiamine pyrophosphokinase